MGEGGGKKDEYGGGCCSQRRRYVRYEPGPVRPSVSSSLPPSIHCHSSPLFFLYLPPLKTTTTVSPVCCYLWYESAYPAYQTALPPTPQGVWETLALNTDSCVCVLYGYTQGSFALYVWDGKKSNKKVPAFHSVWCLCVKLRCQWVSHFKPKSISTLYILM